MVNALIIPVKTIPAEGAAIDLEIDPAEIAPEGVSTSDVTPLHVKGKLSGVEGVFTFAGSVAGAYTGPCDRCAEDIELAFAMKVRWTFIDEVYDDKEPLDEGLAEGDLLTATIGYDGETIDLHLPLWEEVMLARPSKFPPMTGNGTACSVCGKDAADWQSGQDDNEGEEKNTGFAGLRDMFPDLPQGPAEE